MSRVLRALFLASLLGALAVQPLQPLAPTPQLAGQPGWIAGHDQELERSGDQPSGLNLLAGACASIRSFFQTCGTLAKGEGEIPPAFAPALIAADELFFPASGPPRAVLGRAPPATLPHGC